MAQSGKEKTTKSTAGRKCSICTHEQLELINKLIGEGKSFRSISFQFGMAHPSVSRHAETCLRHEIQALIRQKKIKNAVDHYQEISDQLEFAKDLRLAARRYLSDPETGELVLIPRADEIDVMYEEWSSKGADRGYKKKVEKLDALLSRIDGNLEVTKTVVKHVDIRQFALNAINTVDTVLDKFAKIEGLYQQDRPNDDEIAQLRNQIKRVAELEGTDYKSELQLFLSHYADKVKPEIKAKLASELVN